MRCLNNKTIQEVMENVRRVGRPRGRKTLIERGKGETVGRQGRHLGEKYIKYFIKLITVFPPEHSFIQF